MHVKGMLSLGAVLVAAVALVSSSGAGTGASRGTARIDLSTRAAVVHYLRAIHVDPRGVVIQRGARNYAGPNCPGKGWTCTSTAHPVVQVASAGGRNTFQCSAAHCAVVQAAQATAAANTARCVRTTGITQSCSINQVSSSGRNDAIVFMSAVKLTGLTQDASQTASIVQHANGAADPNNPPDNHACVTQYMRLDTATVAPRGMPVVATLDGRQTLTLKQDSRYGNNYATESANGSSGGTCAAFVDPDGVSHPNINQLQTIKQAATGSASIEQDENTHPQGPNLSLDVLQNQDGGGLGPNNTNDTVFSQENKLTAIARTPIGPVIQTQVSPSGGLEATVNQFSSGESHATAIQTEIQCEHAQISTSGTPSCTTGTPPSYNLTQTQNGHVKKGPCCSSQGDNTGDVFNVTQSSTQDSDTGGQNQQNLVQGDCPTTGTCHGDETVKAQTQGGGGTTTHNEQDGSGHVQFSVECTSSTSCTKKNSFPSGDILVSVGDGLVQERDATGALVRTLATGYGLGALTAGLAFDSAGTLYATDFSANDVSHFNGDGTLFGSFGSGYNLDPESIVFDSSDNAYVGQADGSTNILKFSPSGTLLASYAPATEDRGTDWIDLASDGCTVYYTSESTSVKRFDVCTNTQLSDLATGLPGFAAYAVKVLPGGGALVADTDRIRRLDSTGNFVQDYGTGGNTWFSLALDPGGTAFWAGDLATGDVTKFELSSGNVLASFNTGTASSEGAGGLAVAP